jgi:predicted regulator of Ras-like GTPase activity (Roadblock/LC7/MglB family)
MLFTMTPQLSLRIDAILKVVLQRAEGRSVYLCDKGGNIVSRFSQGADDPMADNISALAAGAFFATQELARLIGEGGFQCVLHQGGDLSVYMQSLSNEMLLLVVFGAESNPGLVRLYANQACRSVDALVEEADSVFLGADTLGMEFEIDEAAQPFSRSS